MLNQVLFFSYLLTREKKIHLELPFIFSDEQT
jgi:hypothetical protein